MSECIDHGRKGHPRGGYVFTNYQGVCTSFHRLAYCFSRGITLDHIKGYEVRHKCDNPRCINPQHLEIGDHADNMNDMKVRKRAASGYDNAHNKLTKEQADYIRANYKPYCKVNGCNALARRFGVTSGHVCRIANGERATFKEAE